MKRKLILLRNISEMLMDRLRCYYWSLFLKKLGKNTRIYGGITIDGVGNVTIGDNCTINKSTYIDAFDAPVIIGNNVRISVGVIILTAQLDYLRTDRIHYAKQIIIEDNVWLGSGSILLPGVKIGKNSIIGAGAVVTKSMPANVVAVGIPARVAKEIRFN